MSRKRQELTLTKVLNYRTNRVIKWCTPSIDTHSARVFNPYKSDMSISYESLGFPQTPSGIFEAAYKKAAKVYGADHTLFSVNGSTGSNFIVLRALGKQIPNLRVLAQRNVHKSVIVPCEDYNVNLMFLPPNIDEHLQIFLPNTLQEIVESVKKTKPQVLLITNPTYDGIVLNLRRLIRKIRRLFPELIIYVEEAWGSHLHFSKRLPISAMEAGADICIQSTHKQGGSLQQGGMIHWREGRINSEILLESYRSLSTSSPSFLLLASLDSARELMETKGKEIINKTLHIAKHLEERLQEIPGITLANTEYFKKTHTSVFGKDGTKIIIDTSQTGISGFTIARILEEKYKIIVEKYNTNEILFLVPFSAILEHVNMTIKAIKEILLLNKKKHLYNNHVSLVMPQHISKVLEVGDVAKLLWNQIEKVPLVKASGRISAENITPYPPGIPTTIKGEEFTQEIINYYLIQKLYPNSHILAQDPSLETVLVVK